MISKICNNCNAPNSQNAVYCRNCGNNIQYYSPVYRRNPSIFQARKRNNLAITSFALSLIPLCSLAVFALHLAADNLGIADFLYSTFFPMGEFLLMTVLWINLYIGAYVMSILALIFGIEGRKGIRKRFATMGIIISIFNFSVPFLVSPVNELFLK